MTNGNETYVVSKIMAYFMHNMCIVSMCVKTTFKTTYLHIIYPNNDPQLWPLGGQVAVNPIVMRREIGHIQHKVHGKNVNFICIFKILIFIFNSFSLSLPSLTLIISRFNYWFNEEINLFSLGSSLHHTKQNYYTFCVHESIKNTKELYVQAFSKHTNCTLNEKVTKY